MPNDPVQIRPCQVSDYAGVAKLWVRINRELAPEDMRERFEQYIATALMEELRTAADVFAPSKRNGFWVVVAGEEIAGTFGIERRAPDVTELRRMYLAAEHRGRGIAQRMLQCAEQKAREYGFARMILSTAEVQKAAIVFYRRSGYRVVKTEAAEVMSTKTVGGGLVRYHFEKVL